MPQFLIAYVRGINRLSRWIGLAVMYSIFLMMGILLYSSVSKAFFIPPIWSMELAQFVMVAYFLLGGAYSLRANAHVRMDLLYGTWTRRQRTLVDTVTVLCLIAYLVLLLWGGISSTSYALEYGERSYSAWRPYMAPIKIIMCIGILLTLLQAVAILITDIASLRGVEIDDAGEQGGDAPS
ncbi:TRAP transporter small permease subunit [Caenispirillum bisanense]|uniref:TRAP transporter small permease subunit n=1 Tax=Caenispirillum bisanense TaxID=414052 RepID=UPI0031DA4AC3